MSTLYVNIKKLAGTNSNNLDFQFPVKPTRMAKAHLLEPNQLSSKINKSLNRVAGQIAYNELKN